MKLFKIYLKKQWWFGLIWAIPMVFFSRSYINLKFEFDFIFEIQTYLEITFLFVFWTVFWFFFFWKPNYLHQQSKKKESGA
jgi:hypothetical protein